MICLQKHLPEETKEEGRRPLHGKVGDDVILIGHGLPLAVFLLHILFQVKATLLRDVILFEKCLK